MSGRKKPRPYKVIGITYDGVKILEPYTRSTKFTREEIQEAIRKAIASRGAEHTDPK